jgi:hypothetical protein
VLEKGRALERFMERYRSDPRLLNTPSVQRELEWFSVQKHMEQGLVERIEERRRLVEWSTLPKRTNELGASVQMVQPRGISEAIGKGLEWHHLVSTTPLKNLDRYRDLVECPSCKEIGLTRIAYTRGSITWFVISLPLSILLSSTPLHESKNS